MIRRGACATMASMKSYRLPLTLLCVFLASGASLLGAQGRLALVVGNGSYGDLNVPSAAGDAQAMVTVLEDAGFEVILRTDADGPSLQLALRDFARALKGKETGLFYFSGLADPRDGNALLLAAGTDATKGLALDEVVQYLQSSGLRNAMVFLDVARDRGPGLASGAGYPSATGNAGLVVGLSAPPLTTVAEVRGRNSPFTAALLKYVPQPGMEFTELLRSLRVDVMSRTRSVQQPESRGTLPGPFVFVTPKPGEALPAGDVPDAKDAMTAVQDLEARYLKTLEGLESDSRLDDIDPVVKALQELEGLLPRVMSDFETAMDAGARTLESRWERRVAEFQKAQPEPWESDGDFAARIRDGITRVRKEKAAVVVRFRGDADARRTALVSRMEGTIDRIRRTMADRTWTWSGSKVTVEPRPYDRNARTWDFVLSTTGSLRLVEALTMTADLNGVEDLKSAWTRLDGIVKGNLLAGEITWGIRRKEGTNLWAVVLKDARILDAAGVVTGRPVPASAVVTRFAGPLVTAWFPAGNFAGAESAMATLTVIPGGSDTTVLLDGRPVGTGTWSGRVWEGSRHLQVRAPDGACAYAAVEVTAGRDQSLRLEPRYWKPGEKGPSGGIVIHDKGSFSEGWRWLEVSATDAPSTFPWFNGVHLDIGGAKAKGLGSGAGNTRAIILAQGAGSYAATWCDALVQGGFDDWYLPSKDELALMLQVVPQGVAGKTYWSSSQYSNYGRSYDAWRQEALTGLQSSGLTRDSLSVRALRRY